jgi:hypothetical protein
VLTPLSSPPTADSQKNLVSRIGLITTPISTTKIQPAVHTLYRILPPDKGSRLPDRINNNAYFDNDNTTRGLYFVPYFTRPKGGLACRIGSTTTPILTTLFHSSLHNCSFDQRRRLHIISKFSRMSQDSSLQIRTPRHIQIDSTHLLC